jgi:hypothetical protein
MAGFQITDRDSFFVSVLITGRADSWAKDYWSANLLNAAIEIRAGSFQGMYGATVRTDELKAFRDGVARLHRLESEEATLETALQQLRIRIAPDGEYSLTAECVARDLPLPHPMDRVRAAYTLSFSLSFGRAALAEILKDLEEVVQKYPVVGEPPSNNSFNASGD